jgi:SAM-dependent methyltransferase
VKVSSKLCDAADWFLPGFQEIIENELREVPRFHRKQWESAMIFRTLRDNGKMNETKLGLSMGGGKELIAYAIAPHVKRLVVTDLYEMNTTWDCAKTDDPDEYIKQNKPFPVDDAKLEALRMDMRDLKFPDKTFDFCYSTCAVEHIGDREDFLRHFNEVARVLKDDGVYVFTTEILYGDTTICDDHNYIFSLPFLYDILSESQLQPEETFDARIEPHKINYPAPSTLKQLSSFVQGSLAQTVLRELPHIQLLRGKHPFTCGVFVVRRKEGVKQSQKMQFFGLNETQRFVESGVHEYREMLASTRVSINPFSLLPGESSRFFTDHAEYFSNNNNSVKDEETVFHTDYFWFGSGKRVFEIALRVGTGDRIAHPAIEFRIHRYKTLSSKDVECVSTVTRPAQHLGWMMWTLEMEMDEDYCYAILAKIRNGSCTFDCVEVKSYSAALRKRTNSNSLHEELIRI